MTDWTKERQAAAQARCDAATEGPWEWVEDRWHGGYSGLVGRGEREVVFPNTENDGDTGAAWFEDFPPPEDRTFIAHARTDLPDALAELTQAQARIAQLEAERDEAVEGRLAWKKNAEGCAATAKRFKAERDKLEVWVNDLHSGMYINCVYCGHRYGPEDEVPATMADALKEHIEQCPKHPMSALKAERDKLRRVCQMTVSVIGPYKEKDITDIMPSLAFQLHDDAQAALKPSEEGGEG